MNYAILCNCFYFERKTQKKKIADNCIGYNRAVDNRALQKSKFKETPAISVYLAHLKKQNRLRNVYNIAECLV